MKELQRIFEYQGRQVRTVLIDGEPHFVAKDVCDILEHTNSRMALDRLDADEKGVSIIDTLGGPQEMATVTEPGLYSLVLTSRKPEAKQFKRWVTHEVLPAIRATGQYSATIPRSFAEALRLAANQAEFIEKQAAQLEEAKPKVLFADSVANSETSILVGEQSKILKQNGIDIGPNRLFEWLRNNGYLISRKGTDYNMPSQKSMEMGLFTIKETTINHSDGHISISKTPKITGKGQVYFVNKFLGRTK